MEKKLDSECEFWLKRHYLSRYLFLFTHTISFYFSVSSCFVDYRKTLQ